MTALRVAFVTSWYPSTQHVYHGAFIREQAMAVARQHDVRVIAPHLSYRPSAALPSAASLSADEPIVSRPGARFSIPRRISWSSAADAFTSATRRTLSEWADEGWAPDVIHGHALIPAGWTALSLTRDLGVPSVVTVHSSFVSQPVLTRSSESRVRATILGTDALIAVGPTVARELVEIEPQCQPRLIPNLVDDTFFRVPEPTTTRAPDAPMRILGVGGLIPAKRYDLLLHAIAGLREAGTAVEATILGDGPERARLARQAEQLGIDDIVTFGGAVDRRGVRDHLWTTDVFVHPSRYETFGVVLIEAMACGVPVIATRSGGPDSIVEPGSGQLVDVDDVEALSLAIGQFASGAVSYDPSVVRARAVEYYGIDRITGELDALYQGLAQARG